MSAFVYILASSRNGTLYIGVTRLVYVEELSRIDEAIFREKQLKGWRRSWKIDMIEKSNPDWQDLTASALL